MKNEDLAITVKSISKTFGRRKVLSDISLDLKKGKFLSIFGPNGAGKTTFLKILTTLISPTSGDAQVAGFSIKTHPTEIRKRIGFISHSPLLYRELTTYENLKFYGQMYGVSDLENRIDGLLDQVELSHRRFDVVGYFSRGMFQRLAIARALLHKPEILFLDEPHAGLDPHAVEILEGLINDLKEKNTFIMVTHNLDLGLSLSTDVVILNHGQIVYRSEDIIDVDSFKATYIRECKEGSIDECV